MIALEPHLSEFARDAESLLGCKPAIATVDDDLWIRKFASLAQPSGATTWTPGLSTNDDVIAAIDWRGMLDLWSETPERVLVRRIPFLTILREGASLTVFAARTQANLERGILHGRSLYREWRRTCARVRDARGSEVDVVPVAWDQVYLPERLLEEIRSNVVHFAGARDLYKRLDLPYRRGLLFYGAPGNGKTMLCRAIVTALGWPVVYVSPKSHDDAAFEIHRGFNDANNLAPSVLWFDDVDSLFECDATTSGFLNRLDGASAADGILVLATTNRPERLDPAIVARPSRFDRIFEIGPPQTAERERFLSRRFGAQLNSAAHAALVERTSGMSMAFIQEVFIGAALKALQRGELPNEADATEVHEALVRHSRAADRGFQSEAPTGFAR